MEEPGGEGFIFLFAFVLFHPFNLVEKVVFPFFYFLLISSRWPGPSGMSRLRRRSKFCNWIKTKKMMKEEMKKKETERMASQMLMMKRERLMKVVGCHLDKSTYFDASNLIMYSRMSHHNNSQQRVLNISYFDFKF